MLQINTTDILLKQILHEIQSTNHLQSPLWDINDIARFLKLSKVSIQNRIITRKDFPQPLIIPSTDNRGTKRWESDKIKKWVEKYRELR